MHASKYIENIDNKIAPINDTIVPSKYVNIAFKKLLTGNPFGFISMYNNLFTLHINTFKKTTISIED